VVSRGLARFLNQNNAMPHLGIIFALAKYDWWSARLTLGSRRVQNGRGEGTMELESSAIGGIFIPDILTPGQYYDGVRADSGCARPIKRLMLAVLSDLRQPSQPRRAPAVCRGRSVADG
jgi:hypothetical protein